LHLSSWSSYYVICLQWTKTKHTHTHTYVNTDAYTLIVLYLIALQLLDPRLEFSDYSHCWDRRRYCLMYNIYINILQEGNRNRPWPVGLIINPDPVWTKTQLQENTLNYYPVSYVFTVSRKFFSFLRVQRMCSFFFLKLHSSRSTREFCNLSFYDRVVFYNQIKNNVNDEEDGDIFVQRKIAILWSEADTWFWNR
jgi:hypothetical protein